MTYAMSDIHGCYDQYKQMLKKINFNNQDTLYVLGDIINRGPHPVELLTDMSMQANIIPLMGNHEYVAYFLFKQLLLLEITEENINKHLGSEHDIEAFTKDIINFTEINGGGPTLQGFGKLSNDERMYLLEYMEDFLLYKMLVVNGKKYILTHAGLPKGATMKNLDSFDAFDFATAKTDYSKEYFKDIFLVTGHKPTGAINKQYHGRIYRKYNHIAIDTAAAFGGKLSCICLNTDEEFYI